MDARLAAVVKAYDVRGRSPEQLDTTLVRALAVAFAEETDISGGRGAAVIGRDMRATSPQLCEAFTDGVRSTGADVVDIGLASTDLLYFASGEWNLPGAMITASHNPGAYNGIKLCRAGARPIGRDSGLEFIADRASAVLAGDTPTGDDSPGVRSEREALTDYAQRLRELAPLAPGSSIKVVVDAANGMAGHTVPAVFAGLDVEVIELYFELDGSFPNHEANPLDPTTLVDLQAAVLKNNADIGLAFDGDADRCFVVDETGELVTPSAIAGLIASRYLNRRPGATILHNVICSRAVREVILECGGVPRRTPVGHSIIKAEMARSGAVFGGEHSGHFYFSEFFLADSGMLAALHVLAALTESGGTVSTLMAPYNRYVASGEINSTVSDAAALIKTIAQDYADRDGVEINNLDGLTVDSTHWWFNLRASNTEPLLRLNVEGVDATTMSAVRDDVVQMIAQQPNTQGDV